MNLNYLPSWNANISDLERFSKIKLIISDIDGTLLSTGSKIEHDKFIRLVRDLRNKGVHMTFATGRTYSGVYTLMREIPISSIYPMILYNGSVTLYPLSKKVFFYNKLDVEGLKPLISIIKNLDTSILLYCINSSEMSTKTEITEYVFALGKHKYEIIEPNGQNIIWNMKVPNNILCVAAMIDMSTIKDSASMLKKEIMQIPTISVTQSTNRFLEIRPQHSNKGLAIQKICHRLDIDIDAIMTIGDNDNDEEMFECTRMSVAVNNSSQNAKKKAKFISQYNSLSGVIESLELVRQARRYNNIITRRQL